MNIQPLDFISLILRGAAMPEYQSIFAADFKTSPYWWEQWTPHVPVPCEVEYVIVALIAFLPYPRAPALHR